MGEAVVSPLAGGNWGSKVNEIIMLRWLVIPCAFDSATKMGRFLWIRDFLLLLSHTQMPVGRWSVLLSQHKDKEAQTYSEKSLRNFHLRPLLTKPRRWVERKWVDQNHFKQLTAVLSSKSGNCPFLKTSTVKQISLSPCSPRLSGQLHSTDQKSHPDAQDNWGWSAPSGTCRIHCHCCWP